ncbi:MAG: beta-galactosidase, partial [Phycisphaeraceae bacterium JB051]
LLVQGQSHDIVLSCEKLKLPKQAKTYTLILSDHVHGKAIWQSPHQDVTKPYTLPKLPRGMWWLTLKAYGDTDEVIGFEHLFVSVIESTQKQLDLPESQPISLTAWQQNNQLMVDIANADQRQGTLQINWEKLTGKDLHSQQIDLAKVDHWPLTVSLNWLAPGITAYATLQLQDAETSDEYRVLLGKKGQYPKQSPVIDQSLSNIKPVRTFKGTENASAFAPFSRHADGFREMIRKMPSHGSDAVSLSVVAAQVQPLEGVYDWSEYDQYLAELTKQHVPFLIQSMGSALFNAHPIETWGDWMQTDHHAVDVWRRRLTVSPVSQAYLENAQQTVRLAIERYKNHPLLIGYNFINHGGDSYIFPDHFDRVTDYSTAAREVFREMMQEKYGQLDKLNQAWASDFKAWDQVMPAVPDYEAKVNLHPAWQDFTAFKLQQFSQTSTEMFDRIVDQLDPDRPVVHYVAYTGPVEYMFQKVTRDPAKWMLCDGGGEHHTMDRIANFAKHYGFARRGESHNVPPADIIRMKGLLTNVLRYGSEQTAYALVWNSLPSIHLSHYPKNQKLQDTMNWWSKAMGAVGQMPPTQDVSTDVAVMLSWEDQFYRTLAWRWYAMPGEWARTNLIACNIANPTWLSAISPKSAWDQAKVLLAPDDATIWSEQMVSRVKQFVSSGKHLIVLGNSGQYSLDGSNDFQWLSQLGAKLDVKPISALPVNQQVGDKTYQINATLAVTARDGFKPDLQTPTMVRWTFGQGTVTWLLADTGQTGDMADMNFADNGLTALLKQQLLANGASIQVQSSDPRVSAVVLKSAKKQYLLVSYYISMRKPDAYETVDTSITLPSLRSNSWQLVNMIDTQPAVELSENTQGQQALKLHLQPGDCLLYELIP